MKTQKSIIALVFILFTLTGTITAKEKQPFLSNECRPFAHLNKNMQENLELTDSQREEIWILNYRYWFLRENILSSANKTARNTAVLACWDEWRLTLTKNLTEAQMEKFMEWQSQVDLLGETPY